MIGFTVDEFLREKNTSWIIDDLLFKYYYCLYVWFDCIFLKGFQVYEQA